MPNPDEPTDSEPVPRLMTMWAAGRDRIQFKPDPAMPGRDEHRVLGQYLAETLIDLAATGRSLASDDERQRMHLRYGMTIETYTIVRDRSKAELLSLLAFLSEIMHDVVAGAASAGCEIGDVHQWMDYLRDSLQAAAQDTDIIEGFTQMLAERAADNGS